MGEDKDSIRRQLVVLCRRKNARTSLWSVSCPTEWQPSTVTDPQSGSPFTDIGAWEFVADRLEDGQEIEPVQLDKPPGVTGYVLIIPLAGRQLYVKLQLGSGKVIGCSFHYSNNSQEQHSIRD